MPPTFESYRFISKTFYKMEIGHNRGIRNLHVNHNAPYSTPKILHNLCFSILLGITVVPREIENQAYAKFWGVNKVRYGICASKWCIGYHLHLLNCVHLLSTLSNKHFLNYRIISKFKGTHFRNFLKTIIINADYLQIG